MKMAFVFQPIKPVGLSDEHLGSLFDDGMSFMRFQSPGLDDRIPDIRTIWLFRENLTTAGEINALFERFDAILGHVGLHRHIGADRGCQP